MCGREWGAAQLSDGQVEGREGTSGQSPGAFCLLIHQDSVSVAELKVINLKPEGSGVSPLMRNTTMVGFGEPYS